MHQSCKLAGLGCKTPKRRSCADGATALLYLQYLHNNFDSVPLRKLADQQLDVLSDLIGIPIICPDKKICNTISKLKSNYKLNPQQAAAVGTACLAICLNPAPLSPYQGCNCGRVPDIKDSNKKRCIANDGNIFNNSKTR